jgi:hypothetical protein
MLDGIDSIEVGGIRSVEGTAGINPSVQRGRLNTHIGE